MPDGGLTRGPPALLSKLHQTWSDGLAVAARSPGTICRDTDLQCVATGGFKHFTALALLMTTDFGKLVSDISPPRGHSETKYLSRFVAFRRLNPQHSQE